MSMVRFLGLLDVSRNVHAWINVSICLHDLRHLSSRVGNLLGDMNSAIGATVSVPNQWVNQWEHFKLLSSLHGIPKPHHPRCPRPPAAGTQSGLGDEGVWLCVFLKTND